MALNTITPSNREEEYLSAIAGDEGASAPVPSNRHEEWLRRIAKCQGDQTERLDHIADQIPVDPTSADVGKVMTVIADESGEEPVYKWGAEEASGALNPLSGISATYKLSDGTVTGINKNNTSLGVDNIAAIIGAINALETVGEQYRYIMQHIAITAKGRIMLPADLTNIVSSSAKTNTFYLNAVSEPFKIGVQGTDTLCTVTYSATIRTEDDTKFISFDKTVKNLETSGQTSVAPQNITGIAATGNYMNFSVILYN